ncbi:MAG TPA: 2-oxoglutarate dehydrogenase complex dihydrolipoyllysine-residue succinyltransferase [Tepidisphaeraceae bacterium]|nr:2-oxoglutarate dehydrogenase complex dihydrolipoyllysine-residue succinyltransferase [Tepidisphaeraceae bacterium]
MPTNVDIPALGESVQEAVLLKWHKNNGDVVAENEPLCELETDKANVDIPAPAAGVLRRVKDEGATVHIGETIARIDESAGATGGNGSPAASKPVKAESAPAATPRITEAPKPPVEDLSPAVRRLVEENKLDPKQIAATGPGGRLTKEDVLKHIEGKSAAASAPTPAAPVAPSPAPAPTKAPSESIVAPPTSSKPIAGAMQFDAAGVHRAPMSKMRASIARRLVEAQHTAAILTTFNEVDLTEVISLRSKYKETFEKTHGIGLGFMSFFARAVVLGLREFPRINAFIDGNDVVYHNYVHLGIAVSTDRGLAVPVLRNVQDMSFAKIESEIKRLAVAARDGKLGIEELSGGTFTITNGGIFGSLLSTPILNPPQSGILGMHAIQKRAMVVGDKIEPRSMMYVALSYDHRLVDGRESVSFLVRLKQLLEDPARLMLEI